MIKYILLWTWCCLLAACQSGDGEIALDPQEFQVALNAGNVQLLDVRTPEEWRAGHLKNALQADWNNQTDFRELISSLEKSLPVLVYCASGSRSATAANWLNGKGYKVMQLKGGFNGWKSANMPVALEPNEKPITLAEYKVLTNLGPVVLVDIGADWCPPCKKMDPVIGKLKLEFARGFQLVKIDAGMQTELMKQVNAEKIPTFIIYKNGVETWRKEGLVSISELKKNLK